MCAHCINFRRIWITCVAFGVIGTGAALSITPIYADILNIGKYATVSVDGPRRVRHQFKNIYILYRRKLNIDQESQDMESLTGVVSGILSSAPSLG